MKKIRGLLSLSLILTSITTFADPATTGRWTNIFGEPSDGGLGGKADFATDLVYDGVGNLYMTGCYDSVAFGTIWSRNEACNFFIAKFDADGNQAWLVKKDAGWNKDDRGAKIAMDSAGNIIVSGTTNGKSFTETDPNVFEKVNFVVKYDSDGNELWITYFGNVTDVATQFSMDTSDNIYVAGYSTANDPDPTDSVYYKDAVLYKFDTNGNQLMHVLYDTNTHDEALVTYDTYTKHPYLIVNTYDPASPWPGTRELQIHLLRDDGSKWISKSYTGATTDMKAMVVASNYGNIYIAGSGPTKLFDPTEVQYRYMPYYVASFSTSTYTGQFGKVNWRDRYYVCDGCMYFNDLTIDKYNRLHLTGNFSKNASGNITRGKALTDWGNSIFYSLYSGDGDRFKVDQMGAPNVRDFGGGVAVDEDGNVFLAGGVGGPMNGTDAPGATINSMDFYMTRNEP